MLETLYGSGMRVSELVALNIEDVDLDRGQVRAGTAGRDRLIPLPERATRAVAAYVERSRPLLDLRAQAALFLNHRGRRLTRQGFWLILKSYADATGIAGITPHTLRHTYAAHRLRDGAELGEVQRILGHVNISTTQVYQRLLTDGDGTAAIGRAYVTDGAGLDTVVSLGLNRDLQRSPDGAAVQSD